MAIVQPIPLNPRFQDLTGRKFGNLFVVGYAGRRGTHHMWWGLCSCGSHGMYYGSSVRRSKSCGCKHGQTKQEYLLTRRRITPQDCWEYTGPISSNGYGLVVYSNRKYAAHRLAYETFVGYIPDGMFVCHICDNKQCFNPAHLFLGSPKDNSEDMASKGRAARGENNGFSKLCETEVRLMRQLCESGSSFGEIGRMFGISRSTARQVCNRTIWSHLT